MQLAPITKVYIGYLSLPLKQPFITALRKVETAKDIVIRLEDHDGNLGFGSATEVLAVTGESLESIKRSVIHGILPRVIKRQEVSLLSLEDLNELLSELENIGSSANAMFEIAFYDLLSRQSGKSLTGAYSNSCLELDSCFTISLDKKEKMLNQARYAVSEGFSDLKIKLGSGNIDQDIDSLTSLIKALPQNTRFRVDANQAWNLTDSFKFLDSFSEDSIDKLELVEQPVHKSAIQDLSTLSIKSPVPIFADESVFNFDELVRLHQDFNVSGFVIKLLKTGGLFQAFRMRDYTEKHNLNVMVSSMLETKLGVYTSAIFASSFRKKIFADLDASFLQQGEAFEGGFTQLGPKITLSKAPIDITKDLIDLEKVY